MEYEAGRLQLVVSTLKIPDKKTEIEAKKLEIQLEKMEKMIALKNRADENVLKMRIKQLEQKEASNRILEQRAGDMSYLTSEQVRECLILLETIKALQNKRVSAMMKIIDDKVYLSNLAKNNFNKEGLSTTGEQFGRRDSSVSELLGNYDPEVRALLEKSMQPGRGHGDKMRSPRGNSNDRKEETYHEEDLSDRQTTRPTHRNQRDFAAAFDEYESKDRSSHIKPKPSQFPTRGKDYLVSKAKRV